MFEMFVRKRILVKDTESLFRRRLKFQAQKTMNNDNNTEIAF